ncbi:MAG: response regulator transcription factor [Rhodocyclaceae bacterium]|nr:response regulator transcription factor [Rhodocyclaceae bacterium]
MSTESKPIRVLLVDDNVTMLWGLGKLVQGEYPRMTVVGSVRSADEALVYCHLHPDVTLLDLDLHGCSSIEFIPAIKQRSGGVVLVLTGLHDRRLHEDAMLFGAMGVVRKDEPGEYVLQAIACVHGGKFWGGDADVIAAPQARGDEDDQPHAAAAPGVDALTPAERRLIAELIGRGQAPSPEAGGTPVVLAELVAIYDKLGLRNRLELARFAMAHDLVGPAR